MQTPAPRRSRFEEAVMNSRSSIHPPPDMYLQAVGIDKLLDGFNQENSAPPVRSQELVPPAVAAPAASTASSEGAFGRLSRAVSSFFHGSGFSALGKRKAGSEVVSSTAPVVEDRREQARLAYELAKEQGLLPTPQVFVRPHAKGRRSAPTTPGDPTSLLTPNRALHKSASKKDLNKQKKLSKRVSNLEHKLAEARKELGIALASKEEENTIQETKGLPVSPHRPLTPNNTHFTTEAEPNPAILAESTSKNNAKITKKRKASEAKTVSIYGDSDIESEHEAKKKKVVTPRRTSSRLVKKRSQASTITKEEVIVVVPDGVSVPPIPAIPKDVEGNRVPVTDDGYGGLSHEMF